MKLILMTPPFFFVEEHSILTALFEEGLELLHLRKPNTEPVYSERLLTLIPETYHKHIIVHDHFYLKGEYKLKGIHLNHRNPEPPQGYKGHISCSCHTFDEIKTHKRTFNYMILSPIFNSISKADYPAAFTEEALRGAAKSGIIDKKVMALGGVDCNNIRLLKDYGFGGAVILGDLWNRFNLYSTENYKDLITHFRRLRKLAD